MICKIEATKLDEIGLENIKCVSVVLRRRIEYSDMIEQCTVHTL